MGDSDGFVRGLTLRDGLERARFKAGDSVYGVPAVADNTVYIGDDDGYVYSLVDDRSNSTDGTSSSVDQAATKRDQSNTVDSRTKSQNENATTASNNGTSPSDTPSGVVFGLSATDSILSIIASIVAIVLGVLGYRRQKKRY